MTAFSNVSPGHYKLRSQSAALSRPDPAFSGDRLEVPMMLLYEGTFTDSEGKEVEVDGELLERICENFRRSVNSVPARVRHAAREFFGKNMEPRWPPLIIDHDLNRMDGKRGDVVSLEVKESEGMKYLCGTAVVIGRDSVEAIKKGLLKEVSVGIYAGEEPVLEEVSFVVRGAVPGAAVLMSATRKKRLSNFKAAVNREINGLVRRKLEVRDSNRLSHAINETGIKLRGLVEKGIISLALQKKFALELAKTSESTQTSVCNCLKLLEEHSPVIRGHAADMLGAMQYESNFESLSVGELPDMKLQSPFDSLKKSAGDAKEASKKSGDPAASRFAKMVLGARRNAEAEKKILVLEDGLAEKDEVMAQASRFMSQGHYKKAAVLLRRHTRHEEEDASMAEEGGEDAGDDTRETVERVVDEYVRKMLPELLEDLINDAEKGDMGERHEAEDDESEMERSEDRDDDDKDDDKDDDDEDHEYRSSRKRHKEGEMKEGRRRTRKHAEERDDDDDDDDKDDDEDKDRQAKKETRRHKGREKKEAGCHGKHKR